MTELKVLVLPLYLVTAYFLPWAIENQFNVDQAENLLTKIRNIFKESRRDKDFQPSMLQSSEDGYLTKDDCFFLLDITREYSKYVQYANFPKGDFFEDNRISRLKMTANFQEKLLIYMEDNLLKS